MAEMRSPAIVLRGRDYREADRLVTLLTRDAGKVTVVARGTKKTKSKFSALVEPLTLGHFLLRRGKSLDTLIQGEIIKPYNSLRKDLLLFTYAQYFCEVCERSLPENEPAVPVFTLLLTALETLETEADSARVARCFELNLLDELGFRPVLDACCTCGTATGPFLFTPGHGGLLCGHCPREPGSFPVSGATVAIMQRFLDQGFHRLAVCNVSPAANEEIRKVCAGIFRDSLGVAQLKTLSFLKTMESI
ncbi:DNA repair protein RecO [Dethiobacter alkaliphilus]|uniref:DNA repair protein RecO n=1 Tax=Dethiobacter alkaliphilus AHT 1 TaxID=555088 RepID=C0GKW6_DETAL|nr:DNA repair protein RecO [Dethiobacter alkaliphilus]EEG76018.1 DNA repair protein RecO [Dethiobacter alkaliphilus AHT 1]